MLMPAAQVRKGGREGREGREGWDLCVIRASRFALHSLVNITVMLMPAAQVRREGGRGGREGREGGRD